MINKKRVVLMTQMALHDKRYGDADRAAFSFFRRDFIYRKNVGTRTSVFFGAIILLGLYWLRQIFILGMDIQTIDVEATVMESMLFVLLMLSVYTLVGTIQGTHQYHRIQKRMERYLSMMEQVENIPDSADPLDEITTPLYNSDARNEVSEVRSEARSGVRSEARSEARSGARVARGDARTASRSAPRPGVSSTPRSASRTPVRSAPRTPPSRATAPRPATRPTAPRAASRPTHPPTRRT